MEWTAPSSFMAAASSSEPSIRARRRNGDPRTPSRPVDPPQPVTRPRRTPGWLKVAPGEATTLLLGVSTLVLCALFARLGASGLASRREIGLRAGGFLLAFWTWGFTLLSPDMLGLTPGFHPRFLKRYAELREVALGAIRTYVSEVEAGSFPDEAHSHD